MRARWALDVSASALGARRRDHSGPGSALTRSFSAASACAQLHFAASAVTFEVSWLVTHSQPTSSGLVVTGAQSPRFLVRVAVVVLQSATANRLPCALMVCACVGSMSMQMPAPLLLS